MNRDHCTICLQRGHTASSCPHVARRRRRPAIIRAIDRFTASYPGVAALIAIAFIALGAGVVATFDLENDLRAAQPVVFRSV